jgi:hypothetical protein
MKTANLLAVLLERVLRARTGKWDVIKAAMGSTGDTIRLIAIVLALALSTGAGAVVACLMVCR